MFKARSSRHLHGSVKSTWYNAGSGKPISHPEHLDPQEELKLGDLYVKDIVSEGDGRTIQLWIYKHDRDGQNLGWKTVRDVTQVVHPCHHMLRLSFTEATKEPHWIQESTVRKLRTEQPQCWVAQACMSRCLSRP